jgi:hypothetical protein
MCKLQMCRCADELNAPNLHIRISAHLHIYLGSTKNKGWSYSTGDALSTRIFTIRPETSDSISLKSFMASIMQSTLPRLFHRPR